LQEVERRSFACEHRARGSRDFKNDLVGRQPRAFAGAPVEFDVGVEAVEGSLHPGAAAEYRCFARHDPAPHGLRGGDELRRDIAAAEVLAEGCADLGLEIDWSF